MAHHGSRDYAAFEQLVRALVRDFPQSTWAEEALNNLATYYIQQDEDDQADAVLREMYERFPSGRYADRAAWKAGWTSYRKRNMADTIRYFESAAVDLSTVRLPAGVALLVRTRARGDGRSRGCDCDLSIDDCRLRKHLLRKAGRARPQETRRPGCSEQLDLCAECGADRRRRRRLFSTDRRHHPYAAGARTLRACGEGARVCSREVGRFAGAWRPPLHGRTSRWPRRSPARVSLRWHAVPST